MQRIAIPVLNGQVSPHIGRSETFFIADVADGKVVNQAELPNPGHGPGGPPPLFLAKLGVKRVLAWGIPVHARDMLTHLGVEITLGARGEVRQVLEAYLNGTLELTDEDLEGGACGCNH
ncbi:MAG: NifB/NifX family molybdenum-iron cluster-binding protein [Bacillota bacterium]